jgi:hypothetical protein
VTPARGGPTTPPLALRITMCRGLSSAMPSAPTTSRRHDEEEAPGVHGPQARRKVCARLFQAIQPSGIVCTGPRGHRQEEEGPLHDQSLHQATGAHGAQHWRDAICAHKETKRRKDVAAPSGSAPPKYQMMYHHGSTNPPLHQHQRPQQQWAPHPPQR